MGDIFVLVEHRLGKLRDITLEMLSKASVIAGQMGGKTVAVLLGSDTDSFAEKAAGYCDTVLHVNHALFKDYNSEKYQKALTALISRYQPALIMTGHTSQGVDLAPALAVEMKIPLVTDVIDLEYLDGHLQVTRQYYQGKVNAEYTFEGKPPYLVTIRESCFEAGDPCKKGNIEPVDAPFDEDIAYRRFIEYIEAEAGGDVDITKSAVLVAVGRGIKEQKNLSLIEDLAAAINADVCGSRVIVDAGWLSHDRQVGISGKTVKPKLYIAIGISGAFQHLAGIKAKKVVAINRDPKAPIFSVADFGIVDDLFKVVPKLTEKLKNLRG
jgi:electron transfer flavoprotein alpha subunit